MLFKVIACEVAFREICWVAARARHQLDLTFLTQGYHDNPELGGQRIQQELDALEPERYDAVLAGYALCNNLLRGLRAPAHLPVVVPRAHDCITFFLGSKERYQEVFHQHPGAYYYTSGWLEYHQRGGERVPYKQNSGLNPQPDSYQELVEKYGEDNAKYLMEFMGQWEHNYTHGVWIDFDFLQGLDLKAQVERLCVDRNWEFRQLPGDLSLLQRWVNGDWDEKDFLVVPPGHEVVPTHDERIIAARNGEPVRIE